MTSTAAPRSLALRLARNLIAVVAVTAIFGLRAAESSPRTPAPELMALAALG